MKTFSMVSGLLACALLCGSRAAGAAMADGDCPQPGVHTAEEKHFTVTHFTVHVAFIRLYEPTYLISD